MLFRSSRYQMYQQIYYHRVNRSMEVILHHLLKRAQYLYQEKELPVTPSLARFLAGTWDLQDYLKMDDGVMETNFSMWTESSDPVLADLTKRYLFRRPLANAKINEESKQLLPQLKDLIKKAGFDPDYYTGVGSAFDEPYDAYKPSGKNANSQIEIMQEDGSLIELSQLSPLVKALNGTLQGDERFFFPVAMLKQADFQQYLKNGELLTKK